MFWVLLIIDVIVMVALIAFLVFTIRGLSALMKSRLKNDVVNSLSVYDDLIDKKAERLRELELAEKSLSKQRALDGDADWERKSTITLTPVLPSSASFAPEGFSSDYYEIRNAFGFSKVEIVKEAISRGSSQAFGATAGTFSTGAPGVFGESGREDREMLEAARQLREALDYDMLYELLVLPAGMQRAVMEDVAAGSSKCTSKLFETYLREHEWKDILAFSQWLDAYLFMNSEEVVVSVNPISEFDVSAFEKSGQKVQVRHDEGICEGVTVRTRGKLFDYALLSKDLA